jgi:hypothetical protein
MSIYGYQVEERGGFGFLGFTFAILMNCIGLPGISWVPGSTEVPEAVEMLTLLIGAAGLFGYSLQSIGSWKANKLPRWSVVLWPIRYVISAVGGMAENAQALHVIGISIWGIGMIGVAIRIWSAMGEPAKKLEAAI